MKRDTVQTMTTEWTTIIEPSGGSLRTELRELWEYRQLIGMLIQRDFKTMYAQTILGPLWFLFSVVLSSSVMTLVFGRIAGISTDGIPVFLFYLCGNILWNDFSGCLSSVSNTFTGNVRLMGKVWFPRMCVPIANVMSRQIRFLIEMAMFAVLYIFQGMPWNPQISPIRLLLLPFLILQCMALAMGCGLWLTSVTIKYRDLHVVTSFLLKIWMYATPVVYPISRIPQELRTIFLLNPMAPITESFRSVLFGGEIQVEFLLISIAVTILILLTGMKVFHHAQRSFLDTV